jgi:molybdopterin molybdotransferase
VSHAHHGALVPFDDAIAKLLSSVTQLGSERVPLDEALGRVLAEDIAAPGPLPAFDQSAMDGYAVAAASFGAPPHRFLIHGESAAGGADPPAIGPGEACRIFTGARLPEGADAIVMQEITKRLDDGRVEIEEAVPTGKFVRRRGEDLAEGAVALSRGTRLTPGKIALAAAMNRPTLIVARRPRVMIVATGDELRSPGEPTRPGSVIESNAYFVAAAARALGATASMAPFVRDDLEAAKSAFASALRGCDVLVTIGGVSVGDHDVVKPALAAAGVTLDFWRVKMKPGKPVAVGRAGPVHVIGLPGNPASASLTFTLFGAPLIRALQGESATTPRTKMRVKGARTREAGREEFVRATLVVGDDGAMWAEPMKNQASGAVTSFAEAEALIVIPADRTRVEHGETLEVIQLAT